VINVRVRCSFEIDVEFEDDTADDLIHFMVEENSCPGTSIVGSALEKLIADSDKSRICWACPTGKNEILEIKR
jgi:hypothetical protein